jgi:16S rRNA (guanine527-N7)-methyltransferase
VGRDLEKYVDIVKKDFQQKELERLGLTPEEEQHEQIIKFFCLIYDEMDKDGGVLPSSEKGKVFLHYFCDSIQPLLLFGFKNGATYLDVSAGAGFPSIPTAIFRPDLQMTLVEEDAAKRAFLEEVVAELGLEKVTVTGSLDEVTDKFENGVQRDCGTLQNFTRKAKDHMQADGRLYTYRTERFEEELSDITMNKDEEGVQVSEIAEYDLANQIYGMNLVAFELI